MPIPGAEGHQLQDLQWPIRWPRWSLGRRQEHGDVAAAALLRPAGRKRAAVIGGWVMGGTGGQVLCPESWISHQEIF